MTFKRKPKNESDYSNVRKMHIYHAQKITEKYVNEKGMQNNCIADHIWIYCRYVLDQFKYKEDSSFYKKVEYLSKNIRGETFYMGTIPMAMAGAIIYYVGLLEKQHIRQSELAEYTLPLSEVTLRTSYMKLKKWLNKNPKVRSELAVIGL